MKIPTLAVFCLLLPLFVFTGCPSPKQVTEGVPVPPVTPVAPSTDAKDSTTTVKVAIPQGENHLEGFDADLLQFTDQGSGFFPMAVIRALTDSKTGKPFLENLERFGLVPGERSARNPDGFPVGIVTNTVTNEGDGRQIEMFGFTCAACHTSDYYYKGKTMRVDGSSGLFYVDALGDEIAVSLKDTLEDPDKFLGFLQRFARQSKLNPEKLAILDNFASWEKSSALAQALRMHLLEGSKDLLARLDGQQTDQTPPETHENFLTRVRENPELTSILGNLANNEKVLSEKVFPDLAKIMTDLNNLVYRLKFLKTRGWLSADPAHRLAAGFGRADDFGTARVELFGDFSPDNMKAVNAPVSVPALWNVGKFAWLHWNANTNSVIQRSIGEALGVGATYEAETGKTSVAVGNQMRIEEQVQKLKPPEWPAGLFGAPNEEAVKRGRGVYEAYCAKCHDPQDVDEKGLVRFKLSTLDEIGTDPNDAVNFDKAVTQKDGTPAGFAASIKGLLNTLQETARASMSPEDQTLMSHLELKQSPAKWRDTMTETGGPVYPARPLEAIWATAPYLHNGSVPTLYHLLFPEERPQKFLVGQKDYDPEKVGFQIDPAKITPQPDLTPFEFDTTVSGNSNTGHSGAKYGTELSREDRLALIEYLKVHRDSWPLP